MCKNSDEKADDFGGGHEAGWQKGIIIRAKLSSLIRIMEYCSAPGTSCRLSRHFLFGTIRDIIHTS